MYVFYKEIILEYGVDNDFLLILIILLSGDVSNSLFISIIDDIYVFFVGIVIDIWWIVMIFV